MRGEAKKGRKEEKDKKARQTEGDRCGRTKGNVREQRQMLENRDRCERTGVDVRELG